MEKIKKEDSLAAFVDILGFSQKIINRTEQELEAVFCQLKDLYYETVDEKCSISHSKDIHFTDCAYLHTDLNQNTGDLTPFDVAGAFLDRLATIQYRALLNKNIFLRGGVTRGMRMSENINNDENSKSTLVEFSIAYIDAVQIEKDQASFPIIQLKDGLYMELMKLRGYETLGCLQLPVIDIRGKHYVDYLSSAFDDEEGNKECFKIHKERIISAYNQCKTEESVAIKYAWLAYEYHNLLVNKHLINDGCIQELSIKEEEIPKVAVNIKVK